MRSASRSLVHRIDALSCRAQLAVLGERPGLRSFLFHAVAEGPEQDRMNGVVDPTQTLTLAGLEAFLRHFKAEGHEFVSPSDVAAGLEPDGRYVLMTFDDGYYNNLRILPLLEAHSVPAVFFISTGYVESGEAFWWDVVHRERTRRSAPPERIRAEQLDLKRLTHDGIREHLVREFGAAALRPVGDDDRPLTPDELRDLARHPRVYIGNHTVDHAILTNYSRASIRRQIEGAQVWLERVLGTRPTMISYPNGGHSEEVVRVAVECGLDLGITVDARRSPARPDHRERMRLGRFCFTQGHEDAATLDTFRAPLSLRRLATSPPAARLRRSLGR